MVVIWGLWGFGGPIRVYLGVKLSFCPDTYFLKNRPFSIFSLDFFGKNPFFFEIMKYLVGDRGGSYMESRHGFRKFRPPS